MKYSLSAKEMPRAKTKGFLRVQAIFHRISQLESQYIFSELHFQYCPSRESNIGRVDSPYCSGSWEYIFQYTPSILPALLGVCGKIYPPLYLEYIFQYTPSRAGPIWKNITRLIEQYWRVEFQYQNV